MFSIGISLLSLDPLTSDINSTLVPDKTIYFLFYLITFGSRWPPTSLIFIHTRPPSSHSFHSDTDSLLVRIQLLFHYKLGSFLNLRAQKWSADRPLP